MACCLTAPSHYLNQCWPVNSLHKEPVTGKKALIWWRHHEVALLPVSDAVYPVEYAYSFVVLAVVVVIQSLPFGLTQFIYPYSSGLPHRHTIVSLLQLLWSDQQDRLSLSNINNKLKWKHLTQFLGCTLYQRKFCNSSLHMPLLRAP